MEFEFFFSFMLPMEGETCEISNLKCHVDFQKEISPPPHSKQRFNFFLTKVSGFSFVIFNKRGFVNISGVKNFNTLHHLRKVLQETFNTPVKIENIIIDNITASGKLCWSNRYKFQNLTKLNDISLSLNPQSFPAAIIRPKRHTYIKKIGTIILFSNGKYIIVGCKSEENLIETWKKLISIKNSML